MPVQEKTGRVEIIIDLNELTHYLNFGCRYCRMGARACAVCEPDPVWHLMTLVLKRQVGKEYDMTDYQAENLILHFVTEDDRAEVARTWPADHHPLSDAEAREAIASMRRNYEKNTKGRICHLCLAVCRKDYPGTIMGWCGLDGTRDHLEPEIFILLDEEYRNKGFGTQCVRKLLRIAAEEYALSGVHGGCAKENIASARAMEKGGMVRYGTEENGDPLFRFRANNGSCQEEKPCG